MSNRITDANELIAVLVDNPGDAQDVTGGAIVDPELKWGLGHDLSDASGSYALIVRDDCDTSQNHTLAGTVDLAPKVYTVKPFAAEVQAKRNIYCANGEEYETVGKLLGEGGIDAATEYALWFGAPGWDTSIRPFLLNTDVPTVATAAAPADTLAAAIIKRAQLTIAKDYIVHLGIKSALDLSATGYAYADGPDPVKNTLRIRAVDAPIVVSPYYPDTAIAVTGPLVVRVAHVSAWQQYDYTLNKTAIQGYRLIEIDFNPSTAVRAA